MHIRQAVAPDELWWLVAAKTLLASGKPLYFTSAEYIQADSPHLYLLSLWAAFKGFGADEVVARWPGVVAGLLSILLIYASIILLSSESSKGRFRWAVFMSFLYALSPMAVQGATIIDIDNTVLIPSLLFFCLALFKYAEKEDPLWAVLTSLAVMVTLWVKLTTAVVLLVLFVTVILLRRGNLKHPFAVPAILTAGIGAFVISWYLYCSWRQIPFGQPFAYLVSSFANKSSGLQGTQLARHLLHFTLWAGLFFICLTILQLKQLAVCLQGRWTWEPEYGYMAGALVILAGYSVVGGASFGFPKYQSPAIALVYIAAALILSHDPSIRGPSFRVALTLFAGAFLLQFLVVGDIIHAARYTLRKVAVWSPERYHTELGIFFSKLGLLAVGYGAAVTYVRRFQKGSVLIATLLLMLGANTALTLLQTKAGYQTGYNYGAEGTRETVDYVRRATSGDRAVIAPSEIVYYVSPQSSSYQPDPFWDSPSRIIERLNSPETACFVYSISSNTVSQVRLITLNPSIRESLHRRYSHRTIGSYEIWTVRSSQGDRDGKPL